VLLVVWLQQFNLDA